MMFGLCNAPATFQKLMGRVLKGLVNDKCMVWQRGNYCILDMWCLSQGSQLIRVKLMLLRSLLFLLMLTRCDVLLVWRHAIDISSLGSLRLRAHCLLLLRRTLC